MLAVQFCLSCSACSVPNVPYWLSRFGYTFVAVPSFFFCPPALALAVLSYQSWFGSPILQLCPRSPVLSVLSCEFYHGGLVLSILFCQFFRCPVLVVLFWRFFPSCPLLSVLLWLSYPSSLVLAALFTSAPFYPLSPHNIPP